MVIAVPLALGLLALTYAVLAFLYKPQSSDLNLTPEAGRMNSTGGYVLAIFGLTVIGWLTGQWTGLPSAVVALIPAIAFTATGLLGREDLNSLEWNVLILIAGGIALGSGMKQVGLDDQLVTLLLGNFMSHTAAANLVLPIGVAVFASGALDAAAGTGDTMLVTHVGIGIALAASMAMCLPMSTPPNAIAHSTGEIKTKDLVIVGAVVSAAGIVLVILGGGPIIRFWHSIMAT
jgi:sodium-dependent dicarboxylate transporter 2/3/5